MVNNGKKILFQEVRPINCNRFVNVNVNAAADEHKSTYTLLYHFSPQGINNLLSICGCKLKILVDYSFEC